MMLMYLLAAQIAGWTLDEAKDPFTDKINATAIGSGESGIFSLVAYCDDKSRPIIGVVSTKSGLNGSYLRGGPSMVAIKMRIDSGEAFDFIAYSYQSKMATIGSGTDAFPKIINGVVSGKGKITIGATTYVEGYQIDTVPLDGALIPVGSALKPCI